MVKMRNEGQNLFFDEPLVSRRKVFDPIVDNWWAVEVLEADVYEGEGVCESPVPFRGWAIVEFEALFLEYFVCEVDWGQGFD